MKHYLYLISLLFFMGCANADNLKNTTEDIFKGVIKQSHDNSCGSAALSTLITGIIENSQVSELDIINAIKQISKFDISEEGYSLSDLQMAAKKFSYSAEWRKIAKENLSKIKQPVLLLIGLNSDFPHYVVLRGIRHNEAFLADSIRGNIRIAYDELAKESLNEKYPAWFVMGINPSKNKPKDSTLYLSDNETERHNTHVTVEQSNAITLATLSKSGQFIIDYDLTASLSNNKKDGVITNSQIFYHSLNVRYGITDEFQIAGIIQYTDNQTELKSKNSQIKQNDNDRAYGINISHRFKLDESGKNNIILGTTGFYAEKNDILGGNFNITAYKNTSFAQILAGGSISKQFTHNNEISNKLPKYSYSVFVGANKPFADRYLGFINLSLSDAQAKNNDSQFNRSYSVSTGISYVLSKHFQISPSFGYSFGQMDTFSFGMNIGYVGGW